MTRTRRLVWSNGSDAVPVHAWSFDCPDPSPGPLHAPDNVADAAFVSPTSGHYFVLHLPAAAGRPDDFLMTPYLAKLDKQALIDAATSGRAIRRTTNVFLQRAHRRPRDRVVADTPLTDRSERPADWTARPAPRLRERWAAFLGRVAAILWIRGTASGGIRWIELRGICTTSHSLSRCG